ncbi:hypothetical protein GCM10017690_32820 [Microbacterium terregens]
MHDDYTVTITSPVVVDDRLLGVVGTDVLVDRLEHELLPLLRAGDESIAVVNASGRIVTATDARREPGSMLRLADLADALIPLRDSQPVRTRLAAGVEVIACGIRRSRSWWASSRYRRAQTVTSSSVAHSGVADGWRAQRPPAPASVVSHIAAVEILE